MCCKESPRNLNTPDESCFSALRATVYRHKSSQPFQVNRELLPRREHVVKICERFYDGTEMGSKGNEFSAAKRTKTVLTIRTLVGRQRQVRYSDVG
jgi:hypothetical protein